MRPTAKIEQKLETASRRFGKGIICRILQGPIVAYLVANNLVPKELADFPDPSIAVSSTKYRVFVIPLNSYNDYTEAARQAGVMVFGSSLSQESKAKDTFTERTNPDSSLSSITDLERLMISQEPLLRFLRQNLIMVSIHPSQLPRGRFDDIKKMDVMIDSLDVSQSVSGTLVPRTYTSSEPNPRWSDRR